MGKESERMLVQVFTLELRRERCEMRWQVKRDEIKDGSNVMDESESWLRERKVMLRFVGG